MQLLFLLLCVLGVGARHIVETDKYGCFANYSYCQYLEKCIHVNESCKLPKNEFAKIELPEKIKEDGFKVKVFHLLI
jgi:hypothetical protein